MNRAQRRAKSKQGVTFGKIEAHYKHIYDQQLALNLEHYTQTMIHALILAMNSELGIGKDRGNKVLDKMNFLIANKSLEDLKSMAVERKLL